MANVLKRDKQIQIIHLLCEGTSIRAVERLTGVQKKTVTRLMVRFGNACREMLDTELRGLRLKHVQCDEIWTLVQKKEGRIRVEDRPHSTNIGDQYLFVAFDQETKLIASYAVGKRCAELTRRFMFDLASRIALPKPHDSDDHAFKQGGYRPVIQLSTDGWPAYPEAVSLAFGQHVMYGQIIKDYRNAEQPGRYAAPEMVGVERKKIWGHFDPYSICTSHVERNNLTIRTFMRRFTRLSLGFSKKLENLAAACAIHVAHYNFCRRHSSLRVTPAMAANVTGTLWTLQDFYERAIG